MYDKYLVHIKHFSLFTEYRNILGMQHLAPFWHFKLNKFIPVYSNTFFIGSYQIGTLAFKYKFIIPLYKQYIICTLNNNTEIYIYHQCSSIQQTTYSKENCQKRCFLSFYRVYSYTFMIYKTNVNTEAFLSDLLECKCTNWHQWKKVIHMIVWTSCFLPYTCIILFIQWLEDFKFTIVSR